MERFQWWLSGRVVAFVAALSIFGCGGQSESRSGGSDDGSGGTNSSGSGRGGTDTGGSARGGTGGSARGGTDAGGSAGVVGGAGNGGAISDTIMLEDPNNYTATSELSIPTIETAPGDLTICWTEVTTDLACTKVDPEADVSSIQLLDVRTSEAEATALLNSGELEMSQVDGYLQHNTDRQSTCTELSSLANFGVPVDVAEFYKQRTNGAYLITASRSIEPGFGTVSMVFARPVASSANTRLDLPPGCGLQKLLADLRAADPVRFSYDVSGLLDYQNLTRDALGNSLARNNLDRLTLSFFAGATIADLEARILTLDSFATDRFELELTGMTTVSLYDAVSPETGQRFNGFRRTEAGVWLIRLMCNTCSRAIPEVVAVLEPF